MTDQPARAGIEITQPAPAPATAVPTQAPGGEEPSPIAVPVTAIHCSRRHAIEMPFMYILECKNRSLYVGTTWDPDRRLVQHKEGEGSEYTRHRLPVRPPYSEFFHGIENAFFREKQVQGWGRAKTLALVKGQLERFSPLSRKPRRRDGP